MDFTVDSIFGSAPDSINHDIIKLNNLWRTEIHAPEILIYDEDIVKNVREMLVDQQVIH